MHDNFPHPAWLEAHAINDDDVAEAYESLSAQQRAGLKATIAVQHGIWGESLPLFEQSRTFSASFAVREEVRAVPFAVYLIEADYPYPACLLAAVMPAVLAGTKRILPCFVQTDKNSPAKCRPKATAKPGENIKQATAAPYEPNGSLPNPRLLAAIDLAGIERSFSVTEETAKEILTEMAQTLGPGRLIRIGQSRPDDALALNALRLQIPCMDLNATPCYLSKQQPDYLPITKYELRHEALMPSLTLDQHHEDIWIWPQIDPGWFRAKRIHVFSPQPK